MVFSWHATPLIALYCLLYPIDASLYNAGLGQLTISPSAWWVWWWQQYIPAFTRTKKPPQPWRRGGVRATIPSPGPHPPWLCLGLYPIARLYSFGYKSSFYDLIFDYFNSTIETDFKVINRIEKRIKRSIDYIVVSPRSSNWLYEERLGNLGQYVRYEQRVFPSDPSWGKYNQDTYDVVKRFGRVRILKKLHFQVAYEGY